MGLDASEMADAAGSALTRYFLNPSKMIAIAIGIAIAIDGRHAEFLDSDPDSDRDCDLSPP